MVVERFQLMSVDEYLAFVEDSEEWYEYVDGEVRSMTGAKFDHFVIITNIIRRLSMLLEGKDCQVISSGMLVKAGATRLLAPDLSVVCGEPITESNTRLLLNPLILVEVTSPTSINYDRGAKLEYYLDVSSLQAYLVVDQHRVLVELYTRSDSGWHIQSYTNLEDAAPLEALGCRLPLREIYQNINFETETSSSEATPE